MNLNQLQQNKIIDIKVKPNSFFSKICYDDKRELIIVNLKRPPENGKANQELIKLFKKQLNKKVEIISGETSRLKKVKIIQ